MLDNRTGDMFRWLEPGAAIGGGWAPVGNVGLHAAFGKVSLGKASDVSLGSALSEINRSDGVGSCEVTRLALRVRVRARVRSHALPLGSGLGLV